MRCEKKTHCEVTFRELPRCQGITKLKEFLGQEAAILLFFKMQRRGFYERVEKPSEKQVMRAGGPALGTLCLIPLHFRHLVPE